jgi:hypothetical protein
MVGSQAALALERFQLLHFPECPFRLPAENDVEFLSRQRLKSIGHKNIGFDPSTGRLGGGSIDNPESGGRLRDLMAGISAAVIDWLGQLLPKYAEAWAPDRASLRPVEEATRALRHTARNDLLHIDNFPTRPTNGRRILRVFVNLTQSSRGFGSRPMHSQV